MQPLIIGNWKMNNTVSESIRLITELKSLLSGKQEAEIVVAPPMIALHPCDIALQETPIGLAAQNVHYEENGAYTGEVSASMLLDVNCKYVILGHSERRQYFFESNEIIQKKVKAVLEHEMNPVVCVGERAEDRDNRTTLSVIEDQLRACLRGVTDSEAERVVVAYEPVWAIGTGKAATVEIAQEVHRSIRKLLEDLFSKNVATSVRTIYGGSVNSENAGGFLRLPDVDGLLVGGASLDAQQFVKIIRYGE